MTDWSLNHGTCPHHLLVELWLEGSFSCQEFALGPATPSLPTHLSYNQHYGSNRDIRFETDTTRTELDEACRKGRNDCIQTGKFLIFTTCF